MQENREKALKQLKLRPDSFQWKIIGKIYTKAELLECFAKDSTLCDAIINLSGLLEEREADEILTNLLGKRYRCLVCGTEILTTKAGPNRIECCGQTMEEKEPGQIPSSD
jgi:hypothetical protein